ncbi:MAG: TSUP family transporter [Kineosporiaceae bacterium]
MDDPGLFAEAVLLFAALAAGWVDAVVGGGGLIQLPALLLGLPGAAPAQVLATNKIASIAGTTTSAVTYHRLVHPDLRTAAPMAGFALAGAAAGAASASLLPEARFRPLVLVALVLVAVRTAVSRDLGQQRRPREGQRHRVIAVLFGAAIGFYDGIFGPGTGAFLVFALVGLLGYTFVEASATARIVNAATNLGALLVFIPQGAPLWRLGLAMALANLVGAYLGARMAVARGSGFIRGVFLVVVGVLVLRLGWDVVRELG